MSERREKRAERLFDSIGTLDDRLVQDAMSPKKAREHIARRRRMQISTVAAACLCCIMVVALLKIPDLSKQPEIDDHDNERSEATSANKAPVETQQSSDGNSLAPEEVRYSLEHVLTQSQSSPNVLRLSADEIDLHDKSAKLIWKVDGDDHYNVAQINKVSSLKAITAQLDRPLADLSAEDAEQISIKTWIAYGDGRVDSPYLKHTPGNTGYGVLFDYCAEVEPNSELTNTILDLIQ